jgi:ubiquinone/menaquinone biosynthesis C-methylase UbiE
VPSDPPRTDPDPEASVRTVAREFDAIAPVYDETRPPLDPATVARLAEVLRSNGVRRLLEVGVGTGRVSAPLSRLGFDVTGVDPAPGMIARALRKGVGQVVLGSAYNLPFRPGSFDATIFAHVLHTLDRPEVALREASRVSRRGVFALLVDRTPIGRRVRSPAGDELRRMLREELAREGLVLPASDLAGPMRKERLVLRRFPPVELVSLGERTVTFPADRRLTIVERRADRHTLRLSPEAVRRAVARVRARLPADRKGATVAFRRSYELARWPAHGADPL